MNYRNNNSTNNNDTKYTKKVLVHDGKVIGFININKEHFGNKELTVEQVMALISNTEMQDQTTQEVAQLDDLLAVA